VTTLAITSRPVVLETRASGAMLTDILARIARIRGRTSAWGAEDPVRAEYLAGYSVEADFALGYYRAGFVEGADPAILPGWTLARIGQANAYNAVGQLLSFATGVPRITTRGLLIEGPATNLCANYNANPTDTTGVEFVDFGSGSSFAVVDDATALNDAGLTAICSTGKVYRLIAGASGALAAFPGLVGTTGSCTVSAFIRGGTGLIYGGYDATPAIPASDSYVRRHSVVSGYVDARCTILAQPNQTLYIVLNQAEEGVVLTSPIITTGAAATRGYDNAAIDWPSLEAYTVFVEVVWPEVDVANGMFLEGVGTSGVTIAMNSAGSSVRLINRSGNSPKEAEAAAQPAAGDVVRMAVSSAGDLAADGVALTGAPPSRADWLTQVQIGARNTGTPSLSAGAFIRKLALIPDALSPAELLELTQ